jgi:glutamyl-tRNA reductase
MHLLVAGLSHHTTPIALRERAALSPEEIPSALDRLVHGAGFNEGLILSTCNRTEVYVRRNHGDASQAVMSFLAGTRPDAWNELRKCVVVRRDDEAVSHLFRVAAGLDSLVLGEPEIVRQMGDAYGMACSAGTAGPVLHRTFPRALQVGRRVRSETGIARGIASLAGAAVGLADRVFRDLATCSVLAIGAGETIETALRALRPRATGKLLIVNRTAERAARLATDLGGTCAPAQDLERLVAEADIVVAATASPQPLVRAAPLAPLLAHRGARPLLLLDLGVPRDVEAAVADIPGVYLHTVDDLRTIAERGREERAAEIPRAEAIVAAALSDFKRRRRQLDAEPAIKALLDGMLEVRRAALDGERDLTDAERHAAERVTGKLVDKLLRRLAPRLKDGSVGARELLDAFGIEPKDETP